VSRRRRDRRGVRRRRRQIGWKLRADTAEDRREARTGVGDRRRSRSWWWRGRYRRRRGRLRPTCRWLWRFHDQRRRIEIEILRRRLGRRHFCARRGRRLRVRDVPLAEDSSEVTSRLRCGCFSRRRALNRRRHHRRSGRSFNLVEGAREVTRARRRDWLGSRCRGLRWRWCGCGAHLVQPRREIDEGADEQRDRDGRSIDVDDLEELFLCGWTQRVETSESRRALLRRLRIQIVHHDHSPERDLLGEEAASAAGCDVLQQSVFGGEISACHRRPAGGTLTPSG